jgi:ParB/RepB/Spo0J family partition protein
MNQAIREKVKTGVFDTLKKTGAIPPIIVRPHPEDHLKYEIIDGFHRWDIFRVEGEPAIDAFVLDVDTPTAMRLTATLNYLRGEAEPESYAKYLGTLLADSDDDITTETLASFLPESKSEIAEILESFDIDVETVDVKDEDDGYGGIGGDDDDGTWLEVKFFVAKSQAVVIEAEISRIAAILGGGKNLRGRALEYMAVNSAYVPVAEMVGDTEKPK